jgi:hypothetical protein
MTHSVFLIRNICKEEMGGWRKYDILIFTHLSDLSLSLYVCSINYQNHRRKPRALAMEMNAGIIPVAICQITQYINYYGAKGYNPVFYPRVSTRDHSAREPHIEGAP